MKYCSNCGKQNEEINVFCLDCGAKFDAVAGQAEPQPVAPVFEAPVAEAAVAEATVVEPVAVQPEPVAPPVAPPVYTPPVYNAQPQQSTYQQPVYQQPPQQPAYQQPPQQNYQQPYQPYYQAQPAAPKPTLSSNPGVNLLKQHASSPQVLVCAILFSIMLLINIVSIFSNSSMLSILRMFDNFGMGMGYGMDYSAFQAGFIVGGIVGLTPTILVAIGLWLVWSNAKNAASDRMGTSGFSLITAGVVITFVCVCLLILLGLIASVITIIGGAATSGYGGEFALGGGIFMLIVVGGLATLFIIYYAKILGTIGAAKSTALSGITNPKISMFVPVFNFIVAFFSLFTLFFGGVAGIFSGLINIAFLIMISVVIINYRSQALVMAFKERSPQ